jgi:lipoprotein signal peptidase
VFGPRAASSAHEAWSERLLALLLIALALAAVDQWVKLTVSTPYWAVHHRSDLWFAGSCVLLVAILPLTRVPSRAVAIAAGIFAGGVLGNLLSASTDGLSVPNPIIVMHGMGGIAFNPADTFILAGNLALMTTLIVVCLRYREQLDLWRSARRAALRQRLHSRA